MKSKLPSGPNLSRRRFIAGKVAICWFPAYACSPAPCWQYLTSVIPRGLSQYGAAPTLYCTCYGETDLRFGHQIEQISATHHNAHEVSASGDGVMTMKSMEMIDHTDGELRMLEGYVGRKPPFDQ